MSIFIIVITLIAIIIASSVGDASPSSLHYEHRRPGNTALDRQPGSSNYLSISQASSLSHTHCVCVFLYSFLSVAVCLSAFLSVCLTAHPCTLLYLSAIVFPSFSYSRFFVYLSRALHFYLYPPSLRFPFFPTPLAIINTITFTIFITVRYFYLSSFGTPSSSSSSLPGDVRSKEACQSPGGSEGADTYIFLPSCLLSSSILSLCVCAFVPACM